MDYIDIEILKTLEKIFGRKLYNIQLDQQMVWAYLTGLNNAEEKGETPCMHFVFGSPEFGKNTVPPAPTPGTAASTKTAKTKTTKKVKEKKTANLSKARQDARRLVDGHVSSRVRQLRSAAENKTQY